MRCGVIGWRSNETTQIGTQNPAVSSRLVGPGAHHGPTQRCLGPSFLTGGWGVLQWTTPLHPASAAQQRDKACRPIPSRLILGRSIGLALHSRPKHDNEH